MIEFGAPEYFALILIVLAMAGAGLWLARWRRRAQAEFAGPQSARWRSAPLWPRLALLLIASALIVVAAARPQWGSREVQRERQGVAIVLVLDISQSMQATDATPSRLRLAQDELVRLVEAERGNRVGLVLFAGSAILRSPLTTDSQAMVQLIRRADREASLTRAGSDIGAALEQATRILDASETPGKAIVVVSDGEDFGRAFADKLPGLRERNVLLLTAGVGTPQGSTLTETDARTGQASLKRDAAGQPVVTRLNEDSLRAIAAGGGGRYLRLGGNESLLSLREDIAGLQQTPLGEDQQRIPVERFQLFVGTALVLLAAAWLLPASLALRIRELTPRLPRLRPRPGIALLLLALLGGACSDGGDGLREANGGANQLYAAGDYQGALEAYQELLARRPDVPELSYNAGNTLNRLGSYERAVQETSRALPPRDAQIGATAFYALGNHLFALEQWEQAFDAYRASLLLNSADGDAKHNLELTLLRLLEQEQQEQQQGQGQGPGQQQPQDQGQPGQGQPAGPQQEQAQPGQAPGQPPPPSDPRRDLTEALRGIDEELSFEQAVRILDLLRQQQQRPRPAGANPSSGPDY